MATFTYTDSEAGKQSHSFSSLSEIIKYIEDFGYHGDSAGMISQDGEDLIAYESKEDGLVWQKA